MKLMDNQYHEQTYDREAEIDGITIHLRRSPISTEICNSGHNHVSKEARHDREMMKDIYPKDLKVLCRKANLRRELEKEEENIKEEGHLHRRSY